MSKETIRKLIRFLMANLIIAILIIGSYIFNAFYGNKASEDISTEENTQTQNIAQNEATKNAQTAVQQPIETQQTIVQPTTAIVTSQPATATAQPTTAPISPTITTTQAQPEKPLTAIVQPSQTVTAQVTPPKTSNAITTPTIAKTEPTKTVEPTPTENNKICVSMGPFTLEEKATLDFILKKNNQSDLANISKKLTHQIVWNLGTNKSEAESLFKKQKEGAMSDPKFVLLQNNKKEWIVHIVKVPGSEVVAEKLTKELGEKAQKINAGGKWEHVTLPEGYYVMFENYDLLKDSTIKSIDIMLKPNKEPC